MRKTAGSSVTVPHTALAPDVLRAVIESFVLREGTDYGERELTLDGLRSAHGFLQARIARELHLKRTPTLEFFYDDTTDRALRVEELIAESPIAAPEAESLASSPQGEREEIERR